MSAENAENNITFNDLNSSKKISSMANNNCRIKLCIISKLKELRDEQEFVDELDFHVYNHFAESIPSHTG